MHFGKNCAARAPLLCPMGKVHLPYRTRGAAMQGDPKAQPQAKKQDDDDDRGGFFWFPFFRGRRIEMIPAFLLLALFLLYGFYVWERPVPPAPQQTTAAVPAAPAAVAVETQRWGGSVVFPIEGKDAAGKHAAFDVAVLPKDLAWVSKSATNLALAGQQIPDDQLAD